MFVKNMAMNYLWFASNFQCKLPCFLFPSTSGQIIIDVEDHELLENTEVSLKVILVFLLMFSRYSLTILYNTYKIQPRNISNDIIEFTVKNFCMLKSFTRQLIFTQFHFYCIISKIAMISDQLILLNSNTIQINMQNILMSIQK